MHVVLTHVSPTDRRERIYAGWVAFIDDAAVTIINEGEYKVFNASELRSVIAVMTGEEVPFEALIAHLNCPK